MTVFQIILADARPSDRSTSKITPSKHNFEWLCVQILQVEGVQQVHNFHFWTLCSGRYMGSLQLEVLPSTEHARLVATVRGILKQVGVEQVTIEVTSVD